MAASITAVLLVITRTHLIDVGRRKWHTRAGRRRGRRTLEEHWAAAAHSDETFADPEPVFHVNRMRSDTVLVVFMAEWSLFQTD
jgi:hypothetical protein